VGAVGGITSAFDVDATAPTAFTVGETRTSPLFRGLNGPTRVLNILAGQAHYADAPTVSFSPLSGGDFHGGYVAPVPLGTLVSLSNTGWDIDRVFRLLVSRMNGLENVPHSSGYGGERVPRFVEFVTVARALIRLYPPVMASQAMTRPARSGSAAARNRSNRVPSASMLRR